MIDKIDSYENHKKNRSIARTKAERVLVVSDNIELSLFLKHQVENHPFARAVKIDFCYTRLNKNPREMIEIGAREIDIKNQSAIDDILDTYDLVFSLHCKQIFPKQLVEQICCVNFHPGFNPFNRGWYAQAFSITNDLPIGATIHLMDAEVDHGEIIAQRIVTIDISDTSFEVYRKVIAVEKELIQEYVFFIIDGVFETFKPFTEGNYNCIRDYNQLCALNLQSVDSLAAHLKLLRATTHGDFRNAYFINEGKRYFVRVVIEAE